MTNKAGLSVSDKQRAKGKQRWDGVPAKDRSRSMSNVASKRWDGASQTEDQLREFFETAELQTALASYATMRKQYEMAGRIIDNRIQEGNKEVCAHCGKELDENNRWYNREAVKDDITGAITNVFTCSPACLIAARSGQSKQLKRASPS